MLKSFESQHWIFQMTFAALVVLFALFILAVNGFRNICGFKKIKAKV